MDKTNKINKLIKDNGGVITTKIARENKITKGMLSKMVKEGKIVRIERGKYSSSNKDYDEYFIFQAKYSRCIFSYNSALFIHGLTDKIPVKKEVTVYKGYNNNNIKEKASIRNVEKKYYEIGITNAKTMFGNDIKVYNMERTICDLVKARKKIDSEVFSKAIKEYSKHPNRDYVLLRKYAKIFNIENKIDEIIEVI